MIRAYTEVEKSQKWLAKYRGKKPIFTCTLGFTATALIPGISAAGATPADRQYTAIADAEFLVNGPQNHPQYPLPPLTAGISPVIISRAALTSLDIPIYVFNAGLPIAPSVPTIDLGGKPAQCLTSGQALEISTVEHLLEQGLIWGNKLASTNQDSYIIFSECVVGGTTTALAVLLGLNMPADGKVNSSHPTCNHAQKLNIVQQGLRAANQPFISPLNLIAAIGDPVQIAIAGMAIGASRHCGVMLGGGTQMLAIYALIKSLSQHYKLAWDQEQIIIGTTRWVVEDPTGDTVGLAKAIDTVPLLATQLNFTNSKYPQLQLYEKGFVKEGVGAGASGIATHLYQNWSQNQLLETIENLVKMMAFLPKK